MLALGIPMPSTNPGLLIPSPNSCILLSFASPVFFLLMYANSRARLSSAGAHFRLRCCRLLYRTFVCFPYFFCFRAFVSYYIIYCCRVSDLIPVYNDLAIYARAADAADAQADDNHLAGFSRQNGVRSALPNL